jgi:prophage maintenance system killer protein
VRFLTLEQVIACNEAVRGPDESSPTAEDDDLDRVDRALMQAQAKTDPIDAAAALAYEVTAAQGFYEANKRTGSLLARWFLGVNTSLDVDRVIPSDDRELADLLIAAARGEQVEEAIGTLLHTPVSASPEGLRGIKVGTPLPGPEAAYRRSANCKRGVTGQHLLRMRPSHWQGDQPRFARQPNERHVRPGLEAASRDHRTRLLRRRTSWSKPQPRREVPPAARLICADLYSGPCRWHCGPGRESPVSCCTG